MTREERTSVSGRSLSDRFAAHLEAEAEAITDAWLERGTRDPDLSLDALRDHIPGFLRDLAATVREDDPAEASDAAHADYLRMHVEERLAQGYSVDQLLAEFGELPPTLFDVLDQLIEATPDVAPGEVHDVHRRVQTEVGRIGRLAARLHREAEMEERRRLAERLTTFGRALEHEIREPLHTAMVAVELLERPGARDDPDESREHLRVLRDRLERVTELLAEIRRLNLAEQSLAEEEWVPAREAIREVFGELGGMARTRDVELRTGEIAEGAQLNVPRARLAVRNLVANAIKYADPDEDERWVEVSLRRPPDGAYELSVEDNGIGVPDTLREKIFEPGVRAHPDEGSGTGLGLAIVQQVLEQRGGSVAVEPKDGGTRFVLRLPAPLALRES